MLSGHSFDYYYCHKRLLLLLKHSNSQKIMIAVMIVRITCIGEREREEKKQRWGGGEINGNYYQHDSILFEYKVLSCKKKIKYCQIDLIYRLKKK